MMIIMMLERVEAKSDFSMMTFLMANILRLYLLLEIDDRHLHHF